MEDENLSQGKLLKTGTELILVLKDNKYLFMVATLSKTKTNRHPLKELKPDE